MRVDNRKFAETDVEFKAACGVAEVLNTKRQASKFRMKKGSAFKVGILHQNRK